MPVNLSSPQDIPAPLAESLSKSIGVFKNIDSLDALLEMTDIASLQKDLNSYAEEQGILGFHFTRANLNRIRAQGLIVQNGDDARKTFLQEHDKRLSSEQKRNIVRGWDAYFTSQSNNSRDGKVWFNLTLSSLTMRAAEPLLEFYGGEIIHMPFRNSTDLASIFKTLGEPLVICCELSTSELKTFRPLPWGRVWLSAFHASVNESATQEDLDVYMDRSLPSDRIKNICAPMSKKFSSKGAPPKPTSSNGLPHR